jgi:uncharacterized membrane protein
MHPSIYFALAAALTASLYQVFQRQAAGTNPYIVAIAVSMTAAVAGLTMAIFGGKVHVADVVQAKSLWIFLVLIGLCAFGIDFFISKSYTAGGNVSIIGPILTSGVVILTGILGALFFEEPLTALKIAGLLLMTAGAFLASWTR